MTHSNVLAFDGALTAHRVGAVIISVQRINATAYRTAVAHGATGVEVPELAQSFPTEAEARRAARDAYRAFADGSSVVQVLDRLAAARTGTPAPVVVASPVVLVPRSELPGPAGAVGLRVSEPQYRLLLAAFNAGTAEIARGEGEASVSTLRVMARAGLVDLVTEPWGEPIGARVTGWGWLALSHEKARRAGKVPPQMVPVPAAALALQPDPVSAYR